MLDSNDWANINIGRLSKEQAANIAREARALIDKLSDVYPQGDRKKRGQMKVTLDRFGCYHFYLNHQALVCILLFCKDIPDPRKKDELTDCPPEVPDFLRWEKRGTSD